MHITFEPHIRNTDLHRIALVRTESSTEATLPLERRVQHLLAAVKREQTIRILHLALALSRVILSPGSERRVHACRNLKGGQSTHREREDLDLFFGFLERLYLQIWVHIHLPTRTYR